MTHSVSSHPGSAGRRSRFFRDRRGASAVAFAITAPVALLGITSVISYMNTLQYQQEVQLAADSAALAAAQALNKNASANGTQIATNYFNANAPAGAANAGKLSVVTGASAGTSTVEVDYSGTTATLFSELWLGSSAPVNTRSTGHAATGQPTSSNGNPSAGGGTGTTGGSCTGSGCYLIDAWLSPWPGTLNWVQAYKWATGIQITGNQTQPVQCATPGTWYNMLSDAGIQVNATCSASAYLNGMNYISGFSIMLNINGATHVVTFSEPPPLPPANNATPTVYPAEPNFTVPSNAWNGQITIDGVTIQPPSGCNVNWSGSMGANCYPAFLSKTVAVSYSPYTAQFVANPNNTYNKGLTYIEVAYPGYDILFWPTGYGGWGVEFANEQGDGAQGAPGGYVGQTAAGIYNTNIQDFAMSNSTSVSFQYYWSWPGGGYQNANNANSQWLWAHGF